MEVRLIAIIFERVDYVMQDMKRDFLRRRVEHENYLRQRKQMDNSRSVFGVTDLFANELRARGTAISEQILKVCRAVNPEPNPGLIASLKGTGQAAVEQQAKELGSEMLNFPIFRDNPAFGQKGREPNWTALKEAEEQAARKVQSDLDLEFASAEAKMRRTQETGAMQNFYGPVGSVQNGLGSTVNVTMNIDNSTRNEIVNALDLIVRELRQHPEVLGSSTAELVETATEARDEAQKEQPNKTKLRALVLGVTSGVTTAIQTLGSAGDAYENLVGAVKGLADLF